MKVWILIAAVVAAPIGLCWWACYLAAKATEPYCRSRGNLSPNEEKRTSDS